MLAFERNQRVVIFVERISEQCNFEISTFSRGLFRSSWSKALTRWSDAFCRFDRGFSEWGRCAVGWKPLCWRIALAAFILGKSSICFLPFHLSLLVLIELETEENMSGDPGVGIISILRNWIKASASSGMRRAWNLRFSPFMTSFDLSVSFWEYAAHKATLVQLSN